MMDYRKRRKKKKRNKKNIELFKRFVKGLYVTLFYNNPLNF